MWQNHCRRLGLFGSLPLLDIVCATKARYHVDRWGGGSLVPCFPGGHTKYLIDRWDRDLPREAVRGGQSHGCEFRNPCHRSRPGGRHQEDGRSNEATLGATLGTPLAPPSPLMPIEGSVGGAGKDRRLVSAPCFLSAPPEAWHRQLCPGHPAVAGRHPLSVPPTPEAVVRKCLGLSQSLGGGPPGQCPEPGTTPRQFCLMPGSAPALGVSSSPPDLPASPGQVKGGVSRSGEPQAELNHEPGFPLLVH